MSHQHLIVSRILQQVSSHIQGNTHQHPLQLQGTLLLLIQGILLHALLLGTQGILLQVLQLHTLHHKSGIKCA